LKRFLLSLDRVIERVGNWGLLSSGILMLLMGLLHTYGVTRRYLLNNPEPYSYEISVIFLTACSVLAVSGLQRYRRHLRVDFIANYFSPKVQLIFMDIVTPVLALLYVSIVTWQSLDNAIYSLSLWETSQSAWEEPLWPTKFIIPLSMFWLCLVLIGQLVYGIRTAITGAKPEPEKEATVTTVL
jgi:TRAP-type mannitol/chloroaromatic compound transport system permease small subunit